MLFGPLLQLTTLAALAVAHPGEVHEEIGPAELARRKIEIDARAVHARSCSSQAGQFISARKAKRSLTRRGPEPRAPPAKRDEVPAPYYDEIQNFTCVLAPEVTEGPYYINNEMVRYNLTEDQTGTQLLLDIGILDINTCEPLPGVFVEIWASNATGVYGGYPATLDFGGSPPPSTTDTTATGIPTGGPGGPGGASLSLVRNETFLRGGLPTQDSGVVELATVYPGYYEGRTPHIHMMVHLNWTQSENGTIVSHSGELLHIGQVFFDDSWNDMVFASEPYTLDTNNRTLNSEDSIFAQENENGNNAVVDLQFLGQDLSDGVVGYITVGVNSSSSYSIMNTNYFNSSTTEESGESATPRAEGDL